MGTISKGYSAIKLLKNYTEFSNLMDLINEETSHKFKILPFTLLFGAIDSTESGYKPYNSSPTDYTSFSKVFDGRESIIVEWDNSIVLTPDTTNNKWVKDLQVGTSIDGYLTDDTAGIQFSSSTIDQNFVQESVVRSFTFQLDTIPTLQEDGTWLNEKRPITNDELYKFYQILEVTDESPISDKILGDFNTTNLTNRQWFYITNVTNYYSSTKEFIYSSVTFSSVNDKLAKSGYAIDQYIHIGAPGEGSAFPTLDSNGNLAISDLIKRDTPITHAQIDLFGNSAVSNVVLRGRPTNPDQINANGYTKDIVSSRLLFMYNFLAPIADPIKLNNTPSRNLAVLSGGANYFDINSIFKDWKTNIVTFLYNNLQEKEFEGALGSDFGVTSKTLFADTDPETAKFIAAYWDDTWKVNLVGVYPTNTNPYFSFPISSTENLNPTPTIDYATIQNIDLKKLFMYNYFLNIYQEIVPKDARETTFFTFGDLPVIGGFMNKWSYGLPLGFRNVNNSLWPNTPPLNVLMDGALYWFVQKTLFASENPSGFVPVDLFRDSDSNHLSGLLGANATTISFCANLTDKITTGAYDLTTKTKSNDLLITTDQLAQNPILNGVVDKTRVMLIDNQTTLGDPNKTSYLIDAIEFKTFGKVDYKITFYSGEPQADNSNAVWIGYYSTYAKQTKNINNWTNRLVLSNYLLAGKYRGSNTVFNYPKDIIWPVPPNEGIFNWEPNFNFSFAYQGSPIVTMTGKENNKLVSAPDLSTKPVIDLPQFLQNELNAGKVDTIQFVLNRIITGNGAYSAGSSDIGQVLNISGTYTSPPITIDPSLIGIFVDIGTNQKFQFTPSRDPNGKVSQINFQAGEPNIELSKDTTSGIWSIGLGSFVNWSGSLAWTNPPQEDDYVNINNLNVSITLEELVVTYKP